MRTLAPEGGSQGGGTARPSLGIGPDDASPDIARSERSADREPEDRPARDDGKAAPGAVPGRAMDMPRETSRERPGEETVDRRATFPRVDGIYGVSRLLARRLDSLARRDSAAAWHLAGWTDWEHMAVRDGLDRPGPASGGPRLPEAERLDGPGAWETAWENEGGTRSDRDGP
jgi:hypothetical protein